MRTTLTRTTFTITSLVGLAVLAGPSAVAQSTPMAPSAVSQASSIDRGDLKNKLDKAGVKDREEFKGHLVRAQSPQGQPVLLVIGPKEFDAGKPVDDFNQDKLRQKLTTAGFQNILFNSTAQMVRGEMGEDRQILALTGSAGWQGTRGPSDNKKPDVELLKKSLDKAGLEDTEEFKGKLLRSTASGQTLLMLVGPEDFKPDESADLSAEDLSKLQQGEFSDANVAQDVKMIHAKIGEGEALVLSGNSIVK